MPLNLVAYSALEKIKGQNQIMPDDNLLIASPAGQLKAKIDFPAQHPGAKFYFCAAISKNDSAALQKARRESDFVAVTGLSPELCAWAANAKGVDLLLQPFNSEKCFLDLQTANVLRDNNVFVAILFSDFLESEGFRLSQLMKNAAMCVKICANAKVKLLFFSGAKNEMQMRASKDLASFAVLLGMKKENALQAVRGSQSDFLGRIK